jgi:hypothetical protein
MYINKHFKSSYIRIVVYRAMHLIVPEHDAFRFKKSVAETSKCLQRIRICSIVEETVLRYFQAGLRSMTRTARIAWEHIWILCQRSSYSHLLCSILNLIQQLALEISLRLGPENAGISIDLRQRLDQLNFLYRVSSKTSSKVLSTDASHS